MKKRFMMFVSTIVGNALLAFAICAFVAPKAFIVTSEVKNVNGRGYTLACHGDTV